MLLCQVPDQRYLQYIDNKKDYIFIKKRKMWRDRRDSQHVSLVFLFTSRQNKKV